MTSIKDTLQSAFLRQIKKIGVTASKKDSPSRQRWLQETAKAPYSYMFVKRERRSTSSHKTKTLESRMTAKEVRRGKGEIVIDTLVRGLNPVTTGAGEPPSDSTREQVEKEIFGHAVTDHAQAETGKRSLVVTDHALLNGKRSLGSVEALIDPLQVMSPECKKKKAAGINETAAEGYNAPLAVSRRTENLDSLAERLDYLIRKCDDTTSETHLESDVQKIRLLENYSRRAAHSSVAWTIAVNCMKACRELKERMIRERPVPKGKLDHLDRVEEQACSELFGAFCYLMEGSTGPCVPTPFNKDEVDRLMELCFGSLDDPDRDVSIFNKEEHDRDAKMLFSKYLARKVWCPTPWAKIEYAEKAFYGRMQNKIASDVNEEALTVSRRILEILMHDKICIQNDYVLSRCKDHEHEIKLADPSEFRERQYVPDGACRERGRKEGGKRGEALFGANTPLTEHVIACPILTGGKVRVITIDSVKNTEFIWINKFLGSRFKRLRCSVFGGKVDEWWAKIGGLKVADGEFLISGDLESATDNFDGRITEVLIDDFCKSFYSEDTWQEKSEQIKSFTTSAKFLTRRKQVIHQERGQLMGSVVSFPFLCILSLTAYMFALKEQKPKLYRTIIFGDFEKAWDALHRLNSVGVNGDDVAFAGNREAYSGWMRGVTAIGGIVSKGKSLRNRRYFTINSELWSVDGKINCLRPSLVTALTGDNKYFINPVIEWKEFRLCGLAGIKQDTLYSSRAEAVWQLTDKLKLHLPRNLGGLGLVKMNPSKSEQAGGKLGDDLLAAWIVNEAKKRTKTILAGFDEALDHIEELRTLKEQAGPIKPFWAHEKDKKALSLRYRSRFGAWRLSKQEIVLVFNMLRFPEQYKVTPDVLKRCQRLLPQIEKWRAVTPGEIESELDQLDSLDPEGETKGEALRRWLLNTYEFMMDGYREVMIPEGWKTTYEATDPEDLFLD